MEEYTMSVLEAVFFWISIVFYAITSALLIYSFVFKNERILNRIKYFIGTSFIFHTAAILARYGAVGNLPVAGDYETALGGSWFVILFTLYVVVRQKEYHVVSLGTVPFSFLLLGFGVMRNPILVPMAASVRSVWLYIHVIFAWLAFGAFTVAAGVGLIYLLKERNPDSEFYGKFPDFKRLDDRIFKYVVFGFITAAVMIASGAIWAKNLWGNYWSWDPVETWSLITWLIYGLAIHLRVTMGWKGKRLAWIAIGALVSVIISFFGINLAVKTSLHLFDAWQSL